MQHNHVRFQEKIDFLAQTKTWITCYMYAPQDHNLTCITDGRVLIIGTALLLTHTHKANKKLIALGRIVYENHGRLYMQGQHGHAIYDNTKKSLKTSKVLSLYDIVPFILVCFLTYNTPSSTKKHHKSIEPESHQTDKMLFFLSSSPSSSDGLIQNRVTL